jgi:hypothetical protein
MSFSEVCNKIKRIEIMKLLTSCNMNHQQYLFNDLNICVLQHYLYVSLINFINKVQVP